jgi:hypothetical protein
MIAGFLVLNFDATGEQGSNLSQIISKAGTVAEVRSEIIMGFIGRGVRQRIYTMYQEQLLPARGIIPDPLTAAPVGLGKVTRGIISVLRLGFDGSFHFQLTFN